MFITIVKSISQHSYFPIYFFGIILLVIILCISCNSDYSHDSTRNIEEIINPAKRNGRAMERHQKLVEALQNINEDSIQILLVGDSITEQWKSTGRYSWNRHLDDYNTFNFGVAGDRIEHIFWRFKNSPVDQLTPEVTILLIGTNHFHTTHHTTREIFLGIQMLSHRILEIYPDTHLILTGIFPRGDDFNEYRGKAAQINEALRTRDTNPRITFLEIGHLFLHSDGTINKDLMPDGLHLSEEGYDVWTEALKPLIDVIMLTDDD